MQLDSERGSYRLQEGNLVKLLLKACGTAREGMAAKAARDWKKPGVKGVGEFARVMQEVRPGGGKVGGRGSRGRAVGHAGSLAR